MDGELLQFIRLLFSEQVTRQER